MNVILYRRKFAPHKYLVVMMVTTGITIFMGFGNDKIKSKAHAKTTANHDTLHANLIGCTYLLINLALDGAINSTQDEIFARYRPTGQQMMFWINLFCTIISTSLAILPLPYIPVLHPLSGGRSEFVEAITFIREHPDVVLPLAQFALTGALGQLFIFETLQHFGSLTLVYVLYVHLTAILLNHMQDNHAYAQAVHDAAICRCLQTQTHYGPMARNSHRIRGYFRGSICQTQRSASRSPMYSSHNQPLPDVHLKRVIQEKEKAKIKSL
jgi:UDP-galactose transporter B1